MNSLERYEEGMLDKLCEAFLNLWDAYMLGTLSAEHRDSVCRAWAMVHARQVLIEVSNEMD